MATKEDEQEFLKFIKNWMKGSDQPSARYHGIDRVKTSRVKTWLGEDNLEDLVHDGFVRFVGKNDRYCEFSEPGHRYNR